MGGEDCAGESQSNCQTHFRESVAEDAEPSEHVPNSTPIATKVHSAKALERRWVWAGTPEGCCPDESLHVVFITKPNTGHPSATD
jgi:hypothetical protein